MKPLLLFVALLPGLAAAQVGSPLPITPYTRQLLRSLNQSNAWYNLGIAASNQTQVTNWITTVPSGTHLYYPLMTVASVTNTEAYYPLAIPDPTGGLIGVADYLNVNRLNSTNLTGVDASFSGTVTGASFVGDGRLITNVGLLDTETLIIGNVTVLTNSVTSGLAIGTSLTTDMLRDYGVNLGAFSVGTNGVAVGFGAATSVGGNAVAVGYQCDAMGNPSIAIGAGAKADNWKNIYIGDCTDASIVPTTLSNRIFIGWSGKGISSTDNQMLLGSWATPPTADTFIQGEVHANGGSITNIDGANIQESTINSSKLDAATAAQLAGAITNNQDGVTLSGSFSGTGSGLTNLGVSATGRTGIGDSIWTEDFATVMGYQASGSNYGTAIGYGAAAKSHGTALGYSSSAGESSLSIGDTLTIESINAIGIGNSIQLTAPASNSISIGDRDLNEAGIIALGWSGKGTTVPFSTYIGNSSASCATTQTVIYGRIIGNGSGLTNVPTTLVSTSAAPVVVDQEISIWNSNGLSLWATSTNGTKLLLEIP